MFHILVHKNLGGSYQLPGGRRSVSETSRGEQKCGGTHWKVTDIESRMGIYGKMMMFFLSQGDIMLTYFNTIIANNMLGDENPRPGSTATQRSRLVNNPEL